MSIELSEKLLSDAAGWDVMKMARAYLAQGQVVSSFWGPPLLRGVVQAGEISIRASMVIKNGTDIDNLCTCREAREWGKICAHGVAVGLHWLNAQKQESATTAAAATKIPAKKTPSLLRADDGEPAELFFILPPNFDQAAARGRVMLVIEAKWGGGLCPLNALPKGRTFAFSAADNAALDAMEKWTDGETPALLQLETKDFATLLPALAEHPNITLGKSTEVTVTKIPFSLPVRATLETNGEITIALKEKSSALVMVGDLADIDDVASQKATASADPQPTPESELIRRADRHAVAAAIAGLTLPMREVVVLRDVNGFSYKEIAEVLNLPTGTVMSRLARGRQQLAILLSRADR